MIQQSTNFYPLLKKFTVLLKQFPPKKREQSFWTCPRHLIEFGMRGYFISSNVLVYLEISLILIRNFLTDRQQRVVLNGKCSRWATVSAGVPQESVLGPLFFLVYINDIVDNVRCDIKLFC